MTRPPRTRAFALLAVVFSASPLVAAAAFDPEAGLPLIRNFAPEVYRGHNQIFATARAPDGVMYFGTYGAVVSFDGERWRRIAVSGTWIRALAFGPDGLLYVGGGNLLGRLEPAPDTGELRFVSLAAQLPPAHRTFNTTWSAAATADRVLFTIDGAILAWRDGTFHTWPRPEPRPALRLAGNEVFCHTGERLLRWRSGEWQPFARDPRLASARRVTLLPADGGDVLVALDHGTLLRAAPTGALAPWSTPAHAFLQRAGVRNGLRLADGSYLLSTSGHGLLHLDATGVPLRYLGADSGLAHVGTYGLAHGHGGSVWVETANGLSVFDPLANWSLFDRRNGRPDTIGGEPIRHGQRLIISLADSAPLILRPAPDGLQPARLEPLPAQGVQRISETVSLHGAIIAGSERGIIGLEGAPALVHATPSQVEDMLLLRSMPGLLAVGMLRGLEFVRIAPDFKTETVARVPDFDLEVTNLVETPERTVWAGTIAGVALRARLASDGRLLDATRFDSSRGLPATPGWVKLHATRHGALVCVAQGVFRLDPATDRLVPDSRFAAHVPSGINTLPIDSDASATRFWFQIGTPGEGFRLGCLDLRGPQPRWLPLPAAINDALGFGGARVIEYTLEAGREWLWIGGTRALVRIDLGASSAPPAPPPVVINDISQGEQRRPLTSASLRLPFRREPLHFQFASPAAVTSPLRYETRLLGFAENWTPAPHADVSFTNLLGGPFTLEVRARDALGQTGTPARLNFSVAPPWHRAPVAYAAYVLASLGTVAGFVRWRLQRGERERRRLEALVATRTAELATARDEAEAASRAKSAFLASMSHELRTPLNGVIGYAQVLQSDQRLLPDQQERLRIVRSSGEHLLRMINDVLDLAKIEAGKLELRPAPFQLSELLADITALHRPAAAAKGLDFQTEFSPDLPHWLEGDAAKLRQILDNLLGNAVKFTATGTVTLQVTCAAPTPPPAAGSPVAALRFNIRDTGPGISATDQARLFQPFEQAHTDRPAAPGTGLGLAISRALVERHRGTLTLNSTPGAGSTFSVSLMLPVAAVPSTPAPATLSSIPTGYSGSRRRVLIVDDHAVNRDLLLDLLRPLGFACDAFPDAASALAALQQGTIAWPGLAVLDVRMAGLDGLELTRRLRSLADGRPLRVLLTSASVLTFQPAHGHAAGADDFLAKPFRTADLLEKLAALLDLRWLHAAPAPTPNSAALSAPPALRAISDSARAALLDALDLGDLDAFRARLATLRADQPEPAATWAALDAAAAGFQLAQLRQLLSPA